MRKIIKKAYLIAVLLFDAVILLYTLLIFSMQFTVVQTRLAQFATHQLSDYLNTRIEVQRVRIDFFNRVVMSDLYVEDLHRDTLLYTEDIDLDISLRPLLDYEIRFSSVCLKNATVNLKRYESDEDLNLQFIIDGFAGEDEDTTSGPSFKTHLSSFELIDSRFRFLDFHQPDSGLGFNPYRIDVHDLQLLLEDVDINSEKITADNIELAVKTDQDFEIQHLNGRIQVSSKIVEVSNLFLQTNSSELHGYYAMVTNDWSDYLDFVDSVSFNSRFLPSSISVNDLSYFVQALKGINDIPQFSGSIKGPVRHLKGKDVILSLSNLSRTKMNFELRGLPDVKNTFFFFDIKDLESSKTGIERIPILPFDENKYIELPENIGQLGKIRFKGKISGYITDLVAYGKFHSAIGTMQTDLTLRMEDQFSYAGSVKTVDFDAGKFFFSEEFLGKVSLEAEITGQGLDKKNIKARIDGKVAAIELNKYRYRNIDIAGDFEGEKFRGDIEVKDPNLALKFIGAVDLSTEEKEFTFLATIDSMRPKPLFGLSQFDSTAVISSTLSIDLKVRNIDSLIGSLDVYNTRYSDATDTVQIENFNFTSSRTGIIKNIEVRSDIFDFSIDGQFDMLDGFKTFRHIAKNYLSNIVPEEIELQKDFRFSAEIKDYSLIHETFTPHIWIEEGSYANGVYNSTTKDLTLNAKTLGFKYDDFIIDTGSVSIRTLDESLAVKVNITNYQIAENNYKRSLRVDARLSDNQFNAHVITEGEGAFGADAVIKGEAISENQFEFGIRNASLFIGDSTWIVSDENIFRLDSNRLAVKDLRITDGAQSLSLRGVISPDEKDVMTIGLREFDMSIINLFTADKGLKLEGMVDGLASIKNVYNNMLFQSNLAFDGVVMNDRRLGSGHIKSVWNEDDKKLEVNGKIARGDTNTFVVLGHYDGKDDIAPLHFEFRLHQLPLVTLEPFTQGILSDFHGIGAGIFQLTGSLDKPVFTGDCRVAGAVMTVDYLNTTYRLENAEDPKQAVAVKFTKNEIRLGPVNAVDGQGNKGRVDLEFVHNQFSKLDMDLRIDAKNLYALNTNANVNALYYGQAFVTGKIRLVLEEGQLRVSTDIKTEPNTKFSLPISRSSEVTENSFIEFSTIKKDEEEEKEEEEDALDLILDMKVEATTAAEVRLVFDEVTGDVVRARGHGDLKLRFDKNRGLSMLGEYEIESGDYFFTLQTVVNKRFYIERGSIIRWNGNPYLGELDIVTSYKLRARLGDILPQVDNTVNYDKKVPIELKLKMSEQIASPVMGFDITLPASKESTRGQLRAELSSESCMNQQVFSLLILNSFTPCEVRDDLNPTTSVAKSTAYEAMSNQLSNWLSRISDRVDVGVTYRPENEGADYNSEQVEVALSTQFLNDRFVFEGNVGYGGQNGAAQETRGVLEGSVEYKIRQDGKLRIKAFNKVNDRSVVENDNLYIQGMGISFNHEFWSPGQFFSGTNNQESRSTKKDRENGKTEDDDEVENPEDSEKDGL